MIILFSNKFFLQTIIKKEVPLKKNENNKDNKEFCLVLILPDVIASYRMADSLHDLEHLSKDIKIVGINLVKLTPETVKNLHRKNNAWMEKVGEKTVSLRQTASMTLKTDAFGYGLLIWESLVEYYTSGPVLAIALYGLDACAEVYKHVGNLNPQHAAPGTMRAKFGTDALYRASIDGRAVRNGFYCSNDNFDGLMDTNLFFPKLISNLNK